MIFPILNGLQFRHAPITLTIFFLNLIVLLYTGRTGVEAQAGLDDLMRDHYFVTVQGHVYANFLHEHPSEDYPKFLRDLAEQVYGGSSERAELLGELAFRDFAFLNTSDLLDAGPDKVAARTWHKRMATALDLQDDHPSFVFGLNAADLSLTKWVSYIFVHSGWFHFIGNMIFLLIFGSVLEQQIGGAGYLVTYMLSGVMGAGVFAVMTGVTGSPLVGASGAISGVMTLYCILNFQKPERYFYWLFLPLRGFMGFVFLPAWVGMALWVIGDLSGYLGTVPELGGVAHAAHLGGELAGVLTGLILFGMRRFWPVEESHPTARKSPVPMGVLIPFMPERANHRSGQNRVA